MPAPNFTIQQTDAQERYTNWKDNQGNIMNALQNPNAPQVPGLEYSPVLSINSFTFKLQDLCELFERIYKYNNPGSTAVLHLAESTLAANPINAVRFYLGVENSPANNACLIGVAVTNCNAPGFGGADVTNLPVVNAQPTTETSIYDFSYPCPTTCADPGHSIMD
ncbi:hypothetical protein QQ054_26695 [Oscillatoria amoena NRMC-F 0135]|nr:hypothetical protein [Oscillatoria amoena NRMC-F 0135]